MTDFSFKIKTTDGVARRGEVTTAHGTFQTPAFMATATAATVKAMNRRYGQGDGVPSWQFAIPIT